MKRYYEAQIKPRGERRWIDAIERWGVVDAQADIDPDRVGDGVL